MNSTQHTGDISSIVDIFYSDKWAGMYKAIQAGESLLVLRHGAISFPEGTALKVKYSQRTQTGTIRKYLKAIVHYNSSEGMLLKLQPTANVS
jgi:hypothetical protein